MSRLRTAAPIRDAPRLAEIGEPVREIEAPAPAPVKLPRPMPEPAPSTAG